MKVEGVMHSESIGFWYKGRLTAIDLTMMPNEPIFVVGFTDDEYIDVEFPFVFDGYTQYCKVKDCVVACVQDAKNLKELEEMLQKNFCEHFCETYLCGEKEIVDEDEDDDGTLMYQ